MSNDKCRSIMYECTKLTPNNDIFPDEIKIVLENIVNLKKIPIMHLMIVVLSGVAHWCSRTMLNIDVDWEIPLIFFGVIIGYPGSNKSTTIGLIERATRDIEQYLQIKVEESRVNGSVTIESLLHELEKKRSIIQAFDEFNTFASSFGLYRADKAIYHRSVLNTLWNGPKCYFRQLVKGDIKCDNPWLSIVSAAHPGAIINILKEESNQAGGDGLFARFVFSARISPDDVHKRIKRCINTITGEYNIDSCSYPSLTHIMYFIHLMHHQDVLTLKISPEANEILIGAHNEYNNMVIGFQGYQDVLCTLFSKSRDHLYRVCGLLHLFHQACIYVLKATPQLKYLIFNDAAAESIQKMVILAKENIDEYLTISRDIAQTTVELMKFYVNTKKLLYGFPLITIPPSELINIGASASEEMNMIEQNTYSDNNHNINSINDTNKSVISQRSSVSASSSTFDPFDGITFDTCIKRILLYRKRIISSTQLGQMLRLPGVHSKNIQKVFTHMANSQMGIQSIQKQKKQGKPRVLFTKDDIPKDKESYKYKSMVEFLNQFDITPEQYGDYLESLSEISIISKKVRGAHNHDKIRRSVSIVNVVKELRQEVCNNPSKPITQIYNEMRQTNGTAESVPIFDILRPTLYRDRSTILPKYPITLNNLNIPYNFTKNLYNEQMLFCDATEPSRILGFASLTALKQLAQCQIWNADGTFRTAPKLFTQAYTIHGHNEFSMKPIVFTALPDKNESTYLTFLHSLIAHAQRNHIILSPTSILIDFELSAFNAFKNVFPNTNILFCHFHFAKNVIKHLKKSHLTEELEKENIKQEIANILSLPLIPPNKIITAFQDSFNTLYSINSNFQTFLNYIKKTYIINPRFSPINWNHYATLCERPRTNNHIEGFHRYLNSCLIAKPNIWKWIMQIQKEDEQTIIRTEQEKKQNRTTRPRKRKNILHDICLTNLKNLYEQHLIDIKEYQKTIRNISYAYIDVLHDITYSSDND